MATPLDQIESAALEQTPAKRVQFAERLLPSLGEDYEMPQHGQTRWSSARLHLSAERSRPASLDEVLMRARAGLSPPKAHESRNTFDAARNYYLAQDSPSIAAALIGEFERAVQVLARAGLTNPHPPRKVSADTPDK